MNYNEKNAKRALKQLSKKEGIPLEEIRKEIQFSIDDAIKHANSEELALWDEIKYKGDKPTPEEVIAFILTKIKEK